MYAQQSRVVAGIRIGVGLHRRDEPRDDGPRILSPYRGPAVAPLVVRVEQNERSTGLGGDPAQITLKAAVALRIKREQRHPRLAPRVGSVAEASRQQPPPRARSLPAPGRADEEQVHALLQRNQPAA